LKKANRWDPDSLDFEDWRRLAAAVRVETRTSERKVFFQVADLPDLLSQQIEQGLFDTAASVREIVDLLEGRPVRLVRNFFAVHVIVGLTERLVGEAGDDIGSWMEAWWYSRPDSPTRHLAEGKLKELTVDLDSWALLLERLKEAGEGLRLSSSAVALAVFLQTNQPEEAFQENELSGEGWMELAIHSDFGSEVGLYARKVLDRRFQNNLAAWRLMHSILLRSQWPQPLLLAWCRLRLVRSATVDELLQSLDLPEGDRQIRQPRRELFDALLTRELSTEQIRSVLAHCENVHERRPFVRQLRLKATSFEDWLALVQYSGDGLSSTELSEALDCLIESMRDICQFRRAWSVLQHLSLRLAGLRERAFGWAQDRSDWWFLHGVYRDAESLARMVAVSSDKQLFSWLKRGETENVRSAAYDELVRRLREGIEDISPESENDGEENSAKPLSLESLVDTEEDTPAVVDDNDGSAAER